MIRFNAKRFDRILFFPLFLIIYSSSFTQPYQNGWVGQEVIHDSIFLDKARWTIGVSDFSLGDRCSVFVVDDTVNISWKFGVGNRYRYAQGYIELDQPISLTDIDIFGIDIKGTPCGPQKRVTFKFEDNNEPRRRAATVRWDELPNAYRWCKKISALKKSFYDDKLINWDAIKIISFEVNAEANSENTSADQGIISLTNFICDSIDDWVRVTTLDTFQNSAIKQEIVDTALNAIRSRQTSVGLLRTWDYDGRSYLYGQGLALKLLTIEGIWTNSIPTNGIDSSAKKLATFLVKSQNDAGYWPRAWHSETGKIVKNLEDDSTVWMGDFPWPIIGLQSYKTKSGDTNDSITKAINNGLAFLYQCIDSDGKLYTHDYLNNTKKEVKSCEAYAAVITCLFEVGDSARAERVMQYIIDNGWDSELQYFIEGPPSENRAVLFANTWLSPFMTWKGDKQKACDALSLVGKILYTKGPDTPYGLDGIGPIATWYEGTLSYISAGGPNSETMYNNLLDRIDSEGFIPHYNDSITAAGVWAVKWPSLDGTSWLYYASKGISPFEKLVMASTPALLSPVNGAVDVLLNPKLIWKDSKNATSYIFQLSEDSSFNTIIVNDSGVMDTSATLLSPLTNAVKYFWRVKSANKFGNSEWSDIWNFTTKKQSQTITFPSLPLKTYGDPDFDPGATASSGLAVTYSSSNTSIATIVNNYIHIVSAGICTVYSNQSGNSQYYQAPQVNQSLTINKAVATITLGDLTHTYDGSPKHATTTTSPLGLPATITYTQAGNAVTPLNAGTYDVTATVNDANYQGSATGSLTINKAIAAVTLGNLTHTYDGSPKHVTATTSPLGLPVTITYTQAGNAVTPLNAGTYIVTATVNDANYQGSTTGSLTINKAIAAVTLGNLTHMYDGSPKHATATTSPLGLPITITYTQAGNAVTPLNAGTYDVTAKVNDANYQGSATEILTINKANQSITFDTIPPKSTTDSIFALKATASSGLPVIYFSSDTLIVSIIDSVAYIKGIKGTAIITATQPGDSNFNPADSVSRLLRVDTVTIIKKKTNYINTIPFVIKPQLVSHDFSGSVQLLLFSKNALREALYTIYDELGNVIFYQSRQMLFPDKQNQITLGTWNLTNRKGRKVSPGIYPVIVVFKRGVGQPSIGKTYICIQK